MSIRVFLSEWIFRYGYYHGHYMDTSTRGGGAAGDVRCQTSRNIVWSCHSLCLKCELLVSPPFESDKTKEQMQPTSSLS